MYLVSTPLCAIVVGFKNKALLADSQVIWGPVLQAKKAGVKFMCISSFQGDVGSLLEGEKLGEVSTGFSGL